MEPLASFKLVTKADAAITFGVCVKTIDNYIKSGLLPAPVAFGGREYWHPAQFRDFLDQRFGAKAPAEEREPVDVKAQSQSEHRPVHAPKLKQGKAFKMQRMLELNQGVVGA